MKIKNKSNKIESNYKSIAKPKNKYYPRRSIKTRLKNNSYFNTSPISKGLILLGELEKKVLEEFDTK